ncbi:MAG TPA: molybdopterin-guanine dinucleotide biosynthesis protein MobA [Verrucomicrobia bacterium]|nr:MAG: hypothetical protein A2X46_07340 [Lentisphaerae bacterium GWF2_57_35]HBA83898.1 molybdopterin-guanine dinucleotide biosynthesis protein MobA [Verrucomicrobiota bacterium]
MRHAGIVLAAGASSRMGFPKALLKTADDVPLALRQIHLLQKAGCFRALVVLGCDADRIRAELPEVETATNPDWPEGRFGSIVAGLQAAREADGILLLPVDTAGVREETFSSLLALADSSGASAIRPTFGGEPGKILWLSRRVADRLLELHREHREFRLDRWIRDQAESWPTEDAAILNNINTPDEWNRFVRVMEGES